MSIFAIIRVDQCYDYVEGADCLSVHSTREEAEAEIVRLKGVRDASFKARGDYISDFVDAIELPKTDYNGWCVFLKEWQYPGTHLSPSSFHREMKYFLFNHPVKLKGFDPPEVIRNMNNLFVVEIPEVDAPLMT